MNQEFYRLLEPLLTVGKFLGFPIPNKYGNVSRSKIVSRLLLSYSVLVSVVSFACFLASVMKWRSKMDKSWKLEEFWRLLYHFATLSTYGYFLIMGRKSLGSLLTKWNCTDYFIPMTIKHREFSIMVISLFAMFSTAILETIGFDVDVGMQRLVGLEGATFLEKYFDIAFYKFTALQATLSYHSRLAFLSGIYIFSKLATVATDYGDALCVVFCYGLSSRIQSINEYLKQRLLEREMLKQMPIKGSSQNETLEKSVAVETGNGIPWSRIYVDLIKLRGLADETSRFLSPLFFVFLTVNVSAIVVNLDQSLSPTMVMFLPQWPYYIYISLWHFAIRMVLVIHYASVVYMNSDETMDLIENMTSEGVQNWPEMERVLSMLRRKPVGITFFGTFVITRNLFISILSFVFTIEIMILQASSNANANVSLNSN